LKRFKPAWKLIGEPIRRSSSNGQILWCGTAGIGLLRKNFGTGTVLLLCCYCFENRPYLRVVSGHGLAQAYAASGRLERAIELAELLTTHSQGESLGISFNGAITIAGLRRVILSCPLRELEALETGLRVEHYLEDIVRTNSSLRFIRCSERYSGGYVGNDKFLGKASIVSHGRCLFVVNNGFYVPSFGFNLLANQTKMQRSSFLKIR